MTAAAESYEYNPAEIYESRYAWRSQPVLLPYQRRWVADKSPVKVIEKSRRIGITWAEAGDAVLCAADGTESTWYIGPTENHGLEFIRDCEFWVRSFGMVETAVESMDRFWVNQDGDAIDPVATTEHMIQAFRIRFLPAKGKVEGKEIVALSSRPNNIRGKGRGGGGRLILDEFAFHPDKEELLKAATALLMRGGRMHIISTHDGVNNGFNLMLIEQRQKAAEGNPNCYSVHRATLDDALDEGFFERHLEIERRRGEMAWPNCADTFGVEVAKARYRQWCIDFIGMGADEELFCIPSQFGSGDYFQSDTFPIVNSWQELGRAVPVRSVRCWDFAATKPHKENRDPDWTRGTLCHVLSDGRYLVSSMASLRDGPAEVDAFLETVTFADPRSTETLLMQEPGAAGKSDVDAKARKLKGCQVHVFRPAGSGSSKEAYARVWTSIAKRGDVMLMRGPWNRELLDELQSFPKGRHDDCVDTLSAFFELVLDHKQWDGADGMTAIHDIRRPSQSNLQDAYGRFWNGSDMPGGDADDVGGGHGPMGGGYF